VGDKLPLFDDGAYTVVGTFRSDLSYEARSMTILLSDLQRAIGRKGQVTGFAVFVDHPEDKAKVDRIIKAITALGPKIEARTAKDVKAEAKRAGGTKDSKK
jgi:putative ABC transport system permease protein